MRTDHHGTKRRRRAGERGDVTVQAIVVVPLALLLIFAIVQFAVAWYAKAALTAAAEDGLRYAQTNPTQPAEAVTAASARSNAGFVTDLAGFACILPGTRALVRPLLAAVVQRKLLGVMTVPGAGASSRGSRPGAGAATSTAAGEVIAGEVIDRD